LFETEGIENMIKNVEINEDREAHLEDGIYNVFN